MKKLLFLILVLFTANIAFSQITTNVSLKCQVYASSGTAPTFNIQSLVSDELSKYDGSSVAAGDKLFIIDGSECYELHISSVTLGSGSVLNFVAYDSTGVLMTIPNGQGAVIRKYNSQQVPFIPSGLRSDLSSCILQKIASTVNSLSGGSGVDNCTKTITQTAHGFGDGDVLFWDEAESEYVTFAGNYADATFPIYVVLDSLTANTFTGVSCGIIDEDFSLPEGLYYATNTGLSLTPAAIEYPVLKVYDGKAQVLAIPGLEFNATGKELFDVVTPTGQRQINGGDVLDLHADSVRIAITIADTAATTVEDALRLLKNNANMTEPDSLAALPDVVGTNVLDADILERDSLNSRWINKNYFLRHTNNSVFLGRNTPKITNHTNFLGIGNNALAGYNPGGSPNGVFALGNNALLVYNNAVTETNAPFVLGNNALRSFTGLSSVHNRQFVIGNYAGQNSTGSANEINWLVGNYAGSGLTTGWGNMFAGGTASLGAGSSITTGVGNTMFHIRGFSNVAGANNYLTVFGYDNDNGTITSATNSTFIGSRHKSANAAANYITNVGSFNRSAADYETLVGYYNGQLGTRSSIGSTYIGATNYTQGLGTHTTYDLGFVVGVGAFNGAAGKVSNSINVGHGNLSATQSNHSISMGIQRYLSGGNQVVADNVVRGDSVLHIGHYTGNVPLDSTTLKSSTVINTTNEQLTVTAHGFGAAGTLIALNTTCSSCPAPFANNLTYVYEVIDANTLKSVINLTTAGDNVVNLIARKTVNNSIIIGHNLVPEERTVKLGNTAHTKLTTNKYVFNIDQTLTSTNDKQALRYNHSSGEIEVMGGGVNSDLVTAEQTESITAIKFQIMPVNTTGGAVTITPPASPIAGDWFGISDSRGQAATNNITIDTSTDKLHGASDDHVISIARGFVKLTYVNSTIGWITTN